MIFLVYPLTMNFCPLNGFSLDAEQSVLSMSVRHARQKVNATQPARIKPKSCRTMSHDVA